MKNSIILVASMLLLNIALTYSQTPIDKVQKAVTYAYNTQDPSAGLIALKEVTQYVENSPDTLQAKFYLGIGTAYGQMGQSDSSFYFLNKLEQIASTLESKSLQLKGLNVKGNVLLMLGNHDDALATFYQALEIAGDNDAYLEHANKINGNLAGIFFDKGDFTSAKKYTNKSLELSQKVGSEKSIAFNYLRLGLIAQAEGEIENSLNYGASAEKLFGSLNDTTMLIYSKMTWADVLVNEANYESAIKKFNEAEALAREINDPETLASCYISLGRIYLEQGLMDTANKNGNKALSIATQMKLKSKQKSAYNLLYTIALKNKQFEMALGYKNYYHAISDSLMNTQTNERIAELQTQYETAQKEAQIERLALDNQVQLLEIAKSRNVLIAVSVIFILLLLSSITLFILRNKRIEAERIAQELQVTALKQRVLELQLESPALQLSLELKELNNKITTPLTDREYDMLSFCIEGKSNQEMADKLFVSINTVKFHLRNIYQKLGVNNKKEVFEYVAKSS